MADGRDQAAVLQRALRAHQAGQLAEALALYEEARSAAPGHAFIHYALGTLLHQLGRNAEAVNVLRHALRLDPTQTAWQIDLGAICLASGDRQGAADAFQEAAQRETERADLWGQLGDLRRESGQHAAALHCYREAVRCEPTYAEAWQNLGLVALKLGDVDAAINASRRATALRPDVAAVHDNLGLAQKAAGDPEGAVASHRRAIALQPDNARFANNLGLALSEAGRRDEAIATFRSLLGCHPGHAEARTNLGDALRDAGRVDEAEHAYRVALTSDPDDFVALWNLGNLCWQQGRHREAAQWYEAARRLKPGDASLHSNLLYSRLYDFSLSPDQLLSLHREYSQAHELPLRSARVHRNARDPERRLRIGYVSADFRVHPVAHFLLPILANHDKRAFHVTAYANQSSTDDLTVALQSCVDAWVRCDRLDDNALASRIVDDGIDILIDLAGHTAGNRLPVFARRPAPVQVTYLSYPGTTGMSAMDYRVTDAFADPPGAERGYSEKLIRLPDSLCCYQPAPYMPDLAPPAFSRNGYVTLASFNNYNKLTDECLALWARILGSLPQARLLVAAMPDGQSRDQLIARLEGFGVREGRVDMLGKLPGPAFVRAMQDADIALDPFPLTGGTTTMETLWMGLPTVVLCGDRFISRVGASFLTTAGLTDLIAHSQDDYVRIVRDLATSPDSLDQWRRTLRPLLAASPLLDAGRFTRGLESALRDAWRTWCEQRE